MLIPQAIVQQGGSAGNFVLISDTVLGVDTASFDLTSIVGTYKHLRISLSLMGTAEGSVVMQFNGDTATNYRGQVMTCTSSTVAAASAGGAQTQIGYAMTTPNAAKITVDIPDYSGTTFQKGHTAACSVNLTGGFYWAGTSGAWLNTAAITRINIFPSSGSFVAGSRCSLYGLS